MRRWIFAVFVGGIGSCVLVLLGFWQLDRLEQKEAVIARIDAKLSQPPVEIPLMPDGETDEFLSVWAAGQWQLGEVHVLTSVKGGGPGFRIIAPFRLSDGRRILVDRGFVPEAAKTDRRPVGGAEILGHLVWPDEVDGYTPPPDQEDNIWFARDVSAMARALDTIPVMVVLSSSGQLGAPRAIPVTITLANNHLSYAMQWFGLAFVWAMMTMFYLIKSRVKTSSDPKTTAAKGV